MTAALVSLAICIVFKPTPTYALMQTGFLLGAFLNQQVIKPYLYNFNFPLQLLIIAIQLKKINIVSYLINRRNFDIRIQDSLGNSLLHYSVDCPEIAGFLLQKAKETEEKGINFIDYPNLKGETALYLAVKKQQKEVITLLLNNEAYPNGAPEGPSPLELANKLGLSSLFEVCYANK